MDVRDTIGTPVFHQSGSYGYFFIYGINKFLCLDMIFN